MKRAIAVVGLLLVTLMQPVSAAQVRAAQSACCGQITSGGQAQALANQGLLVIVGVPGRTAHKPGHIAIVHPAMLSPDELAAHGPMITQAGEDNAVLTTTREGFKYHHGAWPDRLLWFSHKVSSQESLQR